MILTHPLEDFRIYYKPYWKEQPPTLTLDRRHQYDLRSTHKPRGLWFSVQDDWRRWCDDEEMQWTSGAQVYKVHVIQNHDLLVISSTEELDAFSLKYQATDDLSRQWRSRGLNYVDQIDWPAVAANHPGIVIHPYLWERRLDGNCHWYYGWDCASGCIWNLDVVKCVTLLFSTPEESRCEPSTKRVRIVSHS